MPSIRSARAAALLPAAAQPLYARLRDQLRADILEGRLRPLDQLPSESEMTSRYGVSRITVRQALNDLQKDGLVVKVHGKGSFVSQRQVAQDLTRLRGLAESLAGEGRTIHGRTLSLKYVPASADVARRLAVEPGTVVCELQSLRYLNREPLSLNRSYMAKAIGERLNRLDIANRDILVVYENDLGLSIGHADLVISAASADKPHSRYLKVPVGAPVLQVQRVIYTSDGQPLHFETASYRSDAFSYSLTVERQHV